jgi:hypothetical protein
VRAILDLVNDLGYGADKHRNAELQGIFRSVTTNKRMRRQQEKANLMAVSDFRFPHNTTET